MKNQLSPWPDTLQPKVFVVYSLTGWESTIYGKNDKNSKMLMESKFTIADP